jgi:hypothetical protein
MTETWRHRKWRSSIGNHAVTTTHLERSLRVRLAETLPGVQAQLRFAPTPPRPDWRAGHFPPDTRTAAALLLLYPRENDVAIPLTIRASGLARHAGQISLPGGATDEGETLSDAASVRGRAG